MTSHLPLLLLLVLGACAEPEDTDDLCATREVTLTYDAWGQGFVRTHCNGCHSSIIAPEQRKGAPAGVDFDTYGGVLSYAERIEARVLAEDNKMPPGGGPTAEEKAMLHEWITCSVLEHKAELAGGQP